MIEESTRLLIRDLWTRAKWTPGVRELWERALSGIDPEVARSALFAAKCKYPYPQPEIAWVLEFIPPPPPPTKSTQVHFVDYEAMKQNRKYTYSMPFTNFEEAQEFALIVSGRVR